MIPQWIIEKKRDGQRLADDEIQSFIAGYTRGEIPDYQMSALAMAIFFQGMDADEIAALTNAMMHSGRLVDTSSLALPKVDKHSTVGIGDKVSLILAPLATCCGVAVPMVSGRGLGITGGTLDKMESISGYRTDLSETDFIEVLRACGCSIIGQTDQLAPADKKLYALRDVTATVPLIPLITASIMCKKMAEGIDALVLDVKYGSGAFMKTLEDARELARSMVAVGKSMDRKVVALITTMDEPLGHDIGNALEVRESIECLQGRGAADLLEVTLALTAQMLVVTEVCENVEQALPLLREKIDSGEALAKFRSMVELHGGDMSIVDDPAKLPRASIISKLPSQREGTVARVDAEAVGKAVLVLGGGRIKTDAGIDPAVGISKLAKIGDSVSHGDPLAEIHANDEAKFNAARTLIEEAFEITDRPIQTPARIVETISS